MYLNLTSRHNTIFFAHEHTYLNVLLNWESINKPLTGTLGSPFDFDISCSRTIFVGNYRNYRYFSIFFQEGGGGACGPTLMVSYGRNFQILSQNYVIFCLLNRQEPDSNW